MTNLRPIVILALLLTPQLSARQDFIWEPATASEYPVADSIVRSYHLMAIRARAADDALKNAPDRAATVGLLLTSGRTAEALDVLDRIVRTRPGEMRAAFAAAGQKGRDLAADKARNYAERLRAAVDAAKRQLPAMPREDAARIARELVSVESELAIQTRSWRPRMEAFVAEYAGTQAALLASVHLLTDRIGEPMLDALDAFIRDHPGTDAAAQALYQKGFHLGHNAFSFGWRAGHDPTERFERVLAIYRELRSGRYPSSEWTEKAPTLLAGFSAYKASYAEGNIDRVLAGYEEVLSQLLERFDRDPSQDAISSLVGYRMAELFKLKGDVIAGIEATFSRLERMARNPHAIKLLRAEMYLRPNDLVLDVADRAALRPKAAPLLEAVMKDGVGLERRRAHATLATLHFSENRLAEARSLYRGYVDAYPASEYAWVAALRAAECDEPTAPARAADLFRAAAERFQSNQIARILGHAYAARASEAAGDFRGALAEYRKTLQAWDARQGLRLSLYSRRQATPAEPFVSGDSGEVVRERLPERIARLERTLAVAGGELVERARHAIAQQKWDDAVAATTAFLEGHSNAPLAGEARYLASRARLEKALELVDADKPDASVAEAVAQLEALSREPLNSATAAAKLALGTLHYLATAKPDPETLVAEALRDWQTLDRTQPLLPTLSALERDVVEIRNAVFQPHGGGVFATATGEWNAFKWSTVSAPFLLVHSALRVKVPGGEVTRLVAYDPFPGMDSVVFLDEERRALLGRIMLRLGGTRTRPWVRVMDTPNQPAGASLNVLALWKKSFWAQPGHWGGWVFESYPIIDEIEFVDEGRTRAQVKVTVGYSGATVQMEKTDGIWIAKALTNFWIT